LKVSSFIAIKRLQLQWITNCICISTNFEWYQFKWFCLVIFRFFQKAMEFWIDKPKSSGISIVFNLNLVLNWCIWIMRWAYNIVYIDVYDILLHWLYGYIDVYDI
jgi:hypothetical protein